jgi:hypothetical protein
MARSKPQPITDAHAKILIIELGVVALSSLLVIGGTVGGWFKLKRKAVGVIEDVI